MSNGAAYRVRKAEGNVGVVAIDDHRHEQAVQPVPDGRVGGQRRKQRGNSRSVFRDVSAVEPESLLTDADRGMWIHGLECTLSPVRVFAQLAVKIVVHGQYQPGRR